MDNAVPCHPLRFSHLHTHTKTTRKQAESAFHKILIGPTAAAASRPTTPEEAKTAATDTTPTAASLPAAAAAAAVEEDDGAAQHACLGVALLAAVAVVAARGGQQEGWFGLGARALLVHTLGKACEENVAAAAGAPAALARVLYGDVGLAHMVSGLAAATAAVVGADTSGGGEQGEGEEEEQDEKAAGLLSGAVARAVVCAGSLAAARVRDR